MVFKMPFCAFPQPKLTPDRLQVSMISSRHHMVWFHHEEITLLLLRYNNVTVSQGFPATSSLVREPAQNGFSCAYQDVILHEVLLGYQEKMTSPVKVQSIAKETETIVIGTG